MSSVLKWVGAAATMALASVGPAMAVTPGGILLSNAVIDSPSFYSTGLSGWSFQIASCQYTVAGVKAPDCSGAEVIPTANGSTLSLVYENAAGTGTPLAIGGNGTADLSVTVNVKAPGSAVIIGATDTIVGTGAGLPNYASATEVITNATWTGTISTQGIAYTTSPTLVSATFSPRVNAVTASSDFGAFGNTTAQVTSVTQTYSVPEPFSMALLGVGFAGVGFVRRKNHRPPAR